jgi:hypothetical protein
MTLYKESPLNCIAPSTICTPAGGQIHMHAIRKETPLMEMYKHNGIGGV